MNLDAFFSIFQRKIIQKLWKLFFLKVYRLGFLLNVFSYFLDDFSRFYDFLKKIIVFSLGQFLWTQIMASNSDFGCIWCKNHDVKKLRKTSLWGGYDECPSGEVWKSILTFQKSNMNTLEAFLRLVLTFEISPLEASEPHSEASRRLQIAILAGSDVKKSGYVLKKIV